MSGCLHYYRLMVDGAPQYVAAVSLFYILRWHAQRARGAVVTVRANKLYAIIEEYAKAHGCRGRLANHTLRYLMRIVKTVLRRVNTSPVSGDIHIVHVDDLLRITPEEVAAMFI
jgi:hypothetical protein